MRCRIALPTVAATLAVATVLALASVAVAQPATPPVVTGEVLIVLATQLPGSIDPRLARVPALRRPPFDTYRSMVLLSSPRIDLRVGQQVVVDLPNGRRIRIRLREVTAEGRYRIQVSINRPGEQDYLPDMTAIASPGDPFFIAGQSFRGGTLVIGIRLGQRATRPRSRSRSRSP